ncbi:unnamed protein product [Pleuronectes platessa]|uniref:Uncharacterized protein n=1 Tax=Pleuronectes platessa TaxID=8262 RepID=A0A9N7TMP0_PLEPL|nr:unnamed protein product [Pleuronectes platessa]
MTPAIPDCRAVIRRMQFQLREYSSETKGACICMELVWLTGVSKSQNWGSVAKAESRTCKYLAGKASGPNPLTTSAAGDSKLSRIRLVVCVVHNFKGKLLLSEESPREQRPNTAMLSMGRMESPLEKYIASQETDDEDEDSSFIKERLSAFLRWLRGLDWIQRLRNKRQQTMSLCNT